MASPFMGDFDFLLTKEGIDMNNKLFFFYPTGCFELGVFFEMAISQPIFNIFSIGKKVRFRFFIDFDYFKSFKNVQMSR